jgi:hypothetical protein
MAWPSPARADTISTNKENVKYSIMMQGASLALQTQSRRAPADDRTNGGGQRGALHQAMCPLSLVDHDESVPL